MERSKNRVSDQPVKSLSEEQVRRDSTLFSGKEISTALLRFGDISKCKFVGDGVELADLEIFSALML